MRIVHYEKVDSTNDTIKSLVKTHGHPLMVSADFQTSGRGRQGAVWHASPGKNLLCSVFHPDIATNESALFIAALCIGDTLDTLGINHFFKLPNDVYVDNKKIAGILIEALSDGRIIIGMGLNVLESLDGHRKATSIYEHSDIDIHLSTLRSRLASHFMQRSMQNRIILFNEFKAKCALNKHKVTLANTPLTLYNFDEHFMCETSKGRLPCTHLNFETTSANE